MGAEPTSSASGSAAFASHQASGSAAPTPAFSPLYLQIKALLLQALHHGEWKPGTPIPSEQELAQRFRVSQGTVRKAIDELAAEHLLLRRQGRGTFVATHAEQRTRYRFLRLHPDHGSLEAAGAAERSILHCQRLRAPAEVSAALGLRSNAHVLQVARVLAFAGQPTILERIWLPAEPFQGLNQTMLEQDTGPLYALFEREFDVRMVRADERIKAVAADTEAALRLQVCPGCALLSVERIAYTYHDQAMELRRGLYRTEQHHYRNALN